MTTERVVVVLTYVTDAPEGFEGDKWADDSIDAINRAINGAGLPGYYAGSVVVDDFDTRSERA